MNNISLNEKQMRRHSIYSVISQEKEKENDRIRILRKFMFENKIRFKNKHNYTEINSTFSNQSPISEKNFCFSAVDNQSHIEIESGNTTKVEDAIEVRKHIEIANTDEDDYYNMVSSDRNDIGSKKGTYTSNIQVKNKKTNDEKSSKVFSMFSDVKSTLENIDEERLMIDNSNRHHMKTSSFKLMTDVKEINYQFKQIPLNRFLHLNNKTFMKFFSYIYNNFEDIVMAHKYIGFKTKMILYKQYSYIITSFKEQYSNFLKIEDYSFKSNTNNFVLSLKVKILPYQNISEFSKQNIKDISYELSYSYEQKGKNLMQIFKFDIFNKKTFPMWLASETEEFKHMRKRIVYTSSVQRYSWNDYLIMNINLIEALNGEIDSIKWHPLQFEKIDIDLYEKKEAKTNLVYDPTRSCEIESLVHIWKNDNEKIKSNETMQYYKKTFERLFKITEIKYDVMKYLYIRIKMTAQQIGMISINLNMKIEIVNKDSPTINESTNISCVNTLTNSKVYQIRKGAQIFFYIIDTK